MLTNFRLSGLVNEYTSFDLGFSFMTLQWFYTIDMLDIFIVVPLDIHECTVKSHVYEFIFKRRLLIVSHHVLAL